MIVKTLLVLCLVLVIVEVLFFPGITGPITPIADVLYGTQYGIIGFTYVCILTQPGQILSGWRDWLEWQYTLFFTQKALEKKQNVADYLASYRWVLKPILTCELCVSGQLGLWLYPFCSKIGYSFSGHLAAICSGILTAYLLAYLWSHKKQN